MAEALTEAERFPWLTEHSRRLLRWLHEHDSAPRFNHHCGDRLDAAGLSRVRAYAAQVHNEPPAWRHGQVPPWLAEFAAFCFAQVPFYRRMGAQPALFADIPPCERADLSREPWAFVPDSLPLDGLIVYNTSGTTGHPLDVLSHPEASSKYLPLLSAALAAHGVRLAGGFDAALGRPRVALVLVCFQRRTFTYASVSAYLDGAGFAKVNLNPADWRDPDDRARYLDDLRPEAFTGDPLSFAELARLPLRHRPRALLSTAMTLLPGLQRDLEARFRCPVIDMYAMNETGPIAVRVGEAYRLLQPRLYVEILDEDGAPCPPGRRGEVVVSGGFNPLLPLLRYRTGDYARLVFDGARPLLMDLEGRPPVVFTAADGREINNIDVTGVLKPFALPQFTLHQAAGGRLTLTVPTGADVAGVRTALLGLFGQSQALDVVEADRFEASGGKVIQYTREAA